MKKFLLWASLLISSSLFGQTTAVFKDANKRLTDDIKIPSGKTETVESGGTLSAYSGTLGIRSSAASFDLKVYNAEALTANRALTLVVGNADRTITLSGNPTLADWFDQNVKSTSSPTFAGVTNSGLTANTLVYANGSKLMSSVTMGNSLALTTGTLDTIQDIRTTASPVFAGLTVDTNTISVDKVNHRLGVGVTSPSATFHVASGSSFLRATISTSTPQVQIGDGTRTVYVGINGNLRPSIIAQTADALYFGANNTEWGSLSTTGVWTLTGGVASSLYTNGTLVVTGGVGVSGNINSNGQGTFVGSDTTYGINVSGVNAIFDGTRNGTANNKAILGTGNSGADGVGWINDGNWVGPSIQSGGKAIAVFFNTGTAGSTGSQTVMRITKPSNSADGLYLSNNGSATSGSVWTNVASTSVLNSYNQELRIGTYGAGDMKIYVTDSGSPIATFARSSQLTTFGGGVTSTGLLTASLGIALPSQTTNTYGILFGDAYLYRKTTRSIYLEGAGQTVFTIQSLDSTNNPRIELNPIAGTNNAIISSNWITGGGILYLASGSNNTALASIAIDQNRVVTLPGGVASTLYTNGTLVVTGGAGISGAVNTNSTITSSGNHYITGSNSKLSASNAGSSFQDFTVEGNSVTILAAANNNGVYLKANGSGSTRVYAGASGGINAFTIVTNDYANLSTGTQFRFGLGANSGNTYGYIDVYGGGGASNAGAIYLGGTGAFTGIGISGGGTLNSVLTIGQQSTFSFSSWGLTGKMFSINSYTLTDSSTAGSATVASATYASLPDWTLAATNTLVTTTDVATLYVGAPSAGTNMTNTNNWSVWAAGRVRIGVNASQLSLKVLGEIGTHSTGASDDENISLKNGTQQWNLVLSGSDQSWKLRDVTGGRYPISVSSTNGTVTLGVGVASTLYTNGTLVVTGGVGVSGAINTNSTATFAGLVTGSVGFRATGTVAPSGGAGLEIQYNTGLVGYPSFLFSYDRGGSAYLGMGYSALRHNFYVSTTSGTPALAIEGDVALGLPLKVNNAYAAGAFTATGTITIKDSTGTTYKVGVSL